MEGSKVKEIDAMQHKPMNDVVLDPGVKCDMGLPPSNNAIASCKKYIT